jgi:hypothetical protein
MVALLNAKPFTPFRLHMSDGGSITIISPELVFPGRRMAVIGILDPDHPDEPYDRWSTLYYMHVTRHELLNAATMPFATPPSDGSGSPAAVG